MKTTAKEYASFKKQVTKWAKLLAPEYKIYFQWGKSEGYAEVCWNKEGAVATMRLGKEHDFPFEINEIAFHEVCHLLLSRFQSEAKPFLAAQFLNEIEHEIIRKLEKVIAINPSLC